MAAGRGHPGLGAHRAGSLAWFDYHRPRPSGRGDPHQKLGRPSLFHRHLIMSGVVLFVYGKLRIKGRKERGEAGLKERKKKEVSEGREGGKERKRKSILVFHVGDTVHPFTGLGHWGEWGRAKVTCIVGWKSPQDSKKCGIIDKALFIHVHILILECVGIELASSPNK